MRNIKNPKLYIYENFLKIWNETVNFFFHLEAKEEGKFIIGGDIKLSHL